ncbi:unnamed protein product [Phytophthora lilii]|uniref:Unnamed protein product n=1 Tax=Phytophthora lilii TaxID=2077276 RepID=A0A9W7CPE5_9STRA|nr:unnamed protein product [Phytophthora lilii]
MSTIPIHPSATISEASFPNSGQLAIDMTDKSAYADFASTPLAVKSQVAISKGEAGNVMTGSLAWGVAVLMGVYTAENVSGSHIISVITFTHAVYGRMPWWKVPGYICAQTLGAFIAAALVYVLHYEKISAVDLETMHFLFVTYPYGVSNYTAFYTEVLLCAFLMSCAYAITDQRNRCPGPVGTPFALALLVMALGSAFSLNTGLGASVNRDLGPRIFAYLAGYKAAFTEYSYYFWMDPFSVVSLVPARTSSSSKSSIP